MTRPFEDLIKPIEIDGETFVPIEEIAKLATGDKENLKFGKPLFKGSKSYPFMTLLIKYKGGEKQIFLIEDDFEIALFDNYALIRHHYQVQIVKNLIKWGFVEP